jgi:hypothetical protein
MLYNFTRCQRLDGTFYGTSGRCRIGQEVSPNSRQFSTGVTWGKYNIPTPGHVRVVKSLLDKSDTAAIIMSNSKNNVDWNLRVLMFRRLLKHSQVDTSRVKFIKASDTMSALREIVTREGPGRTMLALGEDRQPQLRGISSKLGITGEVIKRPPNSESSTLMRQLIDKGNEAELNKVYRDPALVRLAKIIRNEELRKKAE